MASCWICLDDGADHCGKPPVRDCSCRGDDAGFVHVSCLVDYARRKTREFDDASVDFVAPWMNCPNCKQRYQQQLQIDLSDEFKQSVEEQYPECGWRLLMAQNTMLGTVTAGAQKSKERKDETSISVLDQLSMQSPDPAIELLKARTFGLIGQAFLGWE
jgi:hypothetical protein